jgi:hypothetical protein
MVSFWIKVKEVTYHLDNIQELLMALVHQCSLLRLGQYLDAVESCYGQQKIENYNFPCLKYEYSVLFNGKIAWYVMLLGHTS